MNYIKQLNAFYNFIREFNISVFAQCMYFLLFQMYNKNNFNKFKVKTKELQKLMHCSKRLIFKIRKELIDYGLIIYEQGKGSATGTYNIPEIMQNENLSAPKDIQNENLSAPKDTQNENLSAPKDTQNRYLNDKTFIKTKEIYIKKKKDTYSNFQQRTYTPEFMNSLFDNFKPVNW